MTSLEKEVISEHLSARRGVITLKGGLNRLQHFAGAKARCTDTDPFHRAVDLRFHALKVGVPAAAVLVVGVADAVARLRTLAAYLTHF